MQVNVCDMIMSSGKTSSAIKKMNEDTEYNYIFLTPYLKEVERIKQGCSNRNFLSPLNTGGGKLESLHSLLGRGENIASTHALFKHYNEYTIELIKNGNYKLIMDEVAEVVEKYDITSHDIDMLKNEGKISLVGESVHWDKDEYEGKFDDLMYVSQSSNLFLFEDNLMLWLFPSSVFKAFNDITILTYMFDAQIQKYYFDIVGADVKYIGTECVDGVYRFSENCDPPSYIKTLKNKIHIIDEEKLNLIGEYGYALSSTWFKREKNKKDRPLIRKLKNNTLNVYTNKFKSPAKSNMWTTFKDAKSLLSGKGYTTGFISCNARATNEYADRHHLAYLLNVYFNPFLKNYFTKHDIDVKEDEYALSELVQWIWRSAIRNGEDIWIYIPSSRMRHLLTDWLNKLSEG